MSHLDQDHSGGAASILRAIAVDRVITSIGSGHPVLGARGDIERCTAGTQWRSGSLKFAVLHPSHSDYEAKRTTNSMSCVVLITAGVTRLLLTGDVPLIDESALIARDPALRADWLAVPHHGSRSSSGALLLDTLGAGSAVAQAGYRNRFRHPDPEVVARYQARRIQFFRTDHSGAVQWRFARDGSSTVYLTRLSGARYWHNRPGVTPAAAGATPITPEENAAAADAIPGPPEPYAGR